jgi:pyruvate/2-oxoglutarate dehydrogenase complex dihydrolipoamide acyltransferase (E2) component
LIRSSRHFRIALSWLAYAVRATAATLRAHPAINSQWREDGIARMREINIGLGLGAIEKRVKVLTTGDSSDVIAIRPCAYLSLTFDHRVLDGAGADAFVASLKRVVVGAWGDA